ncbi:MAG: hypothetical protein WCL53_08805 [Chloroflexota bacterium]
MSSSNRWLAGVCAVVLVIVAVGVFAATRGGPPSYPADSPEYTVQQYVRAVADRDATKATSYMSSELQARCDTLPRETITNRGRSSVRATLEDVKRSDKTATVRVGITESFGSGPFDGGDSTQTVVFELQQQADGWRFTDAPWPLYCPSAPAKPVR